MSDSLQLQSNDGIIFIVDADVMMCSKMLKIMMTDLGTDDFDDVIQLESVNANILLMVIDWVTHYKDATFPLNENNKISRDLTSWDIDFFKVDQQTLVEIIKAANYLEIPSLMHGACKIVANQIKGMTVEEMRKLFYTQNNLSSVEEVEEVEEEEEVEEVEEKANIIVID